MFQNKLKSQVMSGFRDLPVLFLSNANFVSRIKVNDRTIVVGVLQALLSFDLILSLQEHQD